MSINQCTAVPSFYENLTDAHVLAGVACVHEYAGVSLPARRVVVGSIGAAGITLTRPSGGTVLVSQRQLLAFGGTLTRQFIAIQSDNSVDVSVEY